MLWFRSGYIVTLLFSLVLSTGISVGLIIKCSSATYHKHIAYDPTYNWTIYNIVSIIVIQFYLLGTALFSVAMAFKIWRNNYQLDHGMRHYFTIWVALLVLGVFANLAVAVLGFLTRTQRQNLAHLYEMLARYNQDTLFVAQFEKYQRENNCCGVYSADDWLMVQVRAEIAGGGAGSSFNSLDYGFRQNPSTGKCHLAPPTIPMGCGRRILEELKIYLAALGVLLIFETFLFGALAVFGWKCFFYWLEKEVIVIPEDEISNLIIIEPESSTSTIYSDEYKQSRHFSKSGSSRYAQYGVSSHSPSNYKHSRSGQSSGYTYLSRQKHSPYSNGSYHNTHNPSFLKQPRIHSGALSKKFISRAPTNCISGMRDSYASKPSTLKKSSYEPQYIQRHHRKNPPHSFNHMLHKQEKAIGGRLLGEVRIDHRKDEDGLNPNEETAYGREGHRDHHATLAIVRNKNPHLPKEVFARNLPIEHHGQTGNLAKDIKDLTGATNVDEYIEDIELPVEHYPERRRYHYIRPRRRNESFSRLSIPPSRPSHGPVHINLRGGMPKLSASSVDGSQAQSLVDAILDPVIIGRRFRQNPHELEYQHQGSGHHYNVEYDHAPRGEIPSRFHHASQRVQHPDYTMCRDGLRRFRNDTFQVLSHRSTSGKNTRLIYKNIKQVGHG